MIEHYKEREFLVQHFFCIFQLLIAFDFLPLDIGRFRVVGEEGKKCVISLYSVMIIRHVVLIDIPNAFDHLVAEKLQTLGVIFQELHRRADSGINAGSVGNIGFAQIFYGFF